MNRARAKGTALERKFVDFAKAHGFPFARRIAAAGVLDQGDVSLGDGIPVTIEVKNHNAMDLGTWMKEAEREAIHAGFFRYLVAHNRRDSADRQNYVTLPWWFALELLAAWSQQQKEAA